MTTRPVEAETSRHGFIGTKKLQANPTYSERAHDQQHPRQDQGGHVVKVHQPARDDAQDTSSAIGSATPCDALTNGYRFTWTPSWSHRLYTTYMEFT